MTDTHVHKFNATIITNARNPVLRCACGAWVTRGRLQSAEAAGTEPTLCHPRVAKGLETRLRNEENKRQEESSFWPERKKAPEPDHRPATTAATDEVLHGTRKPT